MKKVASLKLGEKIIIVKNKKEAVKMLPQKHVVYTENEVALLKNKNIDLLKACHEIKKVLGGFVEKVEIKNTQSN